MENASKALIMAGAILLAMLLIALGIRVFNGARNSADETVLDSAEITMFNQKFERFAGKSISGSNVKSLCSFAISNASTNEKEPRKLPTFNYINGTGDSAPTVNDNNGGADASNNIQNYINKIGGIRSGISTNHSYSVSLTYGKSGLITKIQISY